jgi:hypothetical protein
VQRFLLLSIILVAVLTAFGADAGVVVKCHVQALDPSSDAGMMTMYIDDDRARIEFENDDKRQIMIYRGGDDPVLYLIDDHSSTYREMTPKSLKKLRNPVDDELSSIKDQMREMPREVRDAWKAEAREDLVRMERIAKPRKNDRFTYEPTGESRKIRKWAARDYEGFYEGGLEQKYAIASWRDLGLAYDDISVLVDLQNRYGTVAGNLDFVTMWPNAEVPGFPVRVVTYLDGEKMDVVEARSIVRQEINPRLFTLDSGLREQELFQTSSGGGSAPDVQFFGGGTRQVYSTPTAQMHCNKPIHGNQ